MITISNVSKVFDGKRKATALENVSLEIGKGTIVAIVGPSGSGKSTLLNLIGGLDRPTSGDITIDGEKLRTLNDDDLTRVRRDKIGFVFQFFNLLPSLTAAENVALPLLLDGRPRREATKRASASLERLGVGHREAHFPEELSGGEMQRVAIARALVTQPTTLLCDEPTGNLDSTNAADVLTILRDLTHTDRCTIVLVTHDPNAAGYGDRIVRLRDGVLDRDDGASADAEM